MNAGNITLSEREIQALTGYERATKQLEVLHTRGFTRAYISRLGGVVVERSHYEAVSRGEVHSTGKKANLSFFRAA